jgi:DNA-binding NarL/FixJ family response regulator
MPRATVLLADDHAIVVQGLASLLGGEFALVGTVADGAQLLEAARRLRPDVIVTDLTMPGLSGLDVLRQLHTDGLGPKVVILTMHADAHVAAEALRAGASGFVVKHSASEELIAAIRAVLRGGRYMTPSLADAVLAILAEPRASGAGTLTPRQRDVVRLLAGGRTMKEVAAALGISPRTVQTHKYQSLEALGLKTTAELIRYAVEHGLTIPPERG